MTRYITIRRDQQRIVQTSVSHAVFVTISSRTSLEGSRQLIFFLSNPYAPLSIRLTKESSLWLPEAGGQNAVSNTSRQHRGWLGLHWLRHSWCASFSHTHNPEIQKFGVCTVRLLEADAPPDSRATMSLTKKLSDNKGGIALYSTQFFIASHG